MITADISFDRHC